MKRYNQYCGLAKTLDLIGGRWTLLIVRDLLLGPRRYGEIRANLPGLTTNLLAARLKEMEDNGILEKLHLHGVKLYGLTERGAALEPAILALGAWGGPCMIDGPGPQDRVDLRWGMLSLKRRYRGEEEGHVGLQAGDRSFDLRFSPTALNFQEREAITPQATLQGSLNEVRHWMFMGGPFEALTVRGSMPAAESFRRAFGLP